MSSTQPCLVAVAHASSLPTDACSIALKLSGICVSGFFSFFATSSSTSGVARVWCSGFMAGPATLTMDTVVPDSGRASVHDSGGTCDRAG